jgi:hypothetical protein
MAAICLGAVSADAQDSAFHKPRRKVSRAQADIAISQPIPKLWHGIHANKP